MHDDPHQDLDPVERDILRALASEDPLSRALEDRIVGACKKRGLIVAPLPPRSRWFLRWNGALRWSAITAALLVAFVLGTQVGRRAETREIQAEKPAGLAAPSSPTSSSPNSQPNDPARAPAGPEHRESPSSGSSGSMLTAFHMGQDHPLAADPGDDTQDPLGILGKPYEP